MRTRIFLVLTGVMMIHPNLGQSESNKQVPVLPSAQFRTEHVDIKMTPAEFKEEILSGGGH